MSISKSNWPLETNCRKFSWVAIMEDGDTVGGMADTLQDCEKSADRYEPLKFYVAGPTPMDWQKFNVTPPEPAELIIR